MFEVCFVCNDDKTFHTAVSEVRNMISVLNRFVKKVEHNEKYYHLIQQLNNDRKHIHFMCGHCMKVNEMELRNLEYQLDELLVSFLLSAKEKNNYYYEILHMLQGHYPLKYKIIERYMANF